jgi:hypothetical protein
VSCEEAPTETPPEEPVSDEEASAPEAGTEGAGDPPDDEPKERPPEQDLLFVARGTVRPWLKPVLVVVAVTILVGWPVIRWLPAVSLWAASQDVPLLVDLRLVLLVGIGGTLIGLHLSQRHLLQRSGSAAFLSDSLVLKKAGRRRVMRWDQIQSYSTPWGGFVQLHLDGWRWPWANAEDTIPTPTEPEHRRVRELLDELGVIRRD